MKRRYKRGDWFRVPLDARVDGLGLITHACRSRLFGYFFALRAGETLSHAQLKALGPQTSCARMLFGGAPLEDLRWPIEVRSLTFDAERWPLPEFAVRGAFGRTWARRTLDPQTLQIQSTQPATPASVTELPLAHFAPQSEVEELLSERLCGIARAVPHAVCELRSPINPASLDVLAGGGRVQTATPLSKDELQMLARELAQVADIELRLHGMYGEPFDLRLLYDWPALQALAVDTTNVRKWEALAELRALRRLRLGAGGSRLELFASLPELRSLDVQGPADGRSLASYRCLEHLTLRDSGPIGAGAFGLAGPAQLVLVRTPADIGAIALLPNLRALELRDLQLASLPDLRGAHGLQALTLRDVRLLRDFEPLTAAPALRRLKIEAMPQLHPRDFAVLLDAPHISVGVDLGNRTLNREVYRLLRRGRVEV